MLKVNIDWLDRAQRMPRGVNNFIDGRSFKGHGKIIEKIGPRDGSMLYQFRSASEQDVAFAVDRAKAAYEDGRWAKMPLHRRKERLYKLANLMEHHADEFALGESLDVGKPIREAREFDVPTAVDTIRHSAEIAEQISGRVYGADERSLSFQLRRPVGVVGAIVGWNFPLLLATGKIGPALAMGNSLVLKPSELSSYSASRLAELVTEAGIPEGVFNVVLGEGPVGAALAYHNNVGLLTFTGSTETGKKLLLASGQSNMKRMILECGGKAPNIVFDDSPNLNAVADAVVARAFWNQGQVCTASSRLLVQESVKESLLPLIVQKASALIPRDPLMPDSTFGAIVSLGHKNKVQSYVAAGKREGARVVHQSDVTAPNEGGFYVSPTIFEAVSEDQKIAQEEIFGPVLSVLSFRSEDEAVRIANGTIYGLSAIIWTKDIARAHRMTQSVDAGWIVVNATDRPMGGPGVGVLSVSGLKQSGQGTEGGAEGMEAYTTSTAVQIFV